MSRSENRKCFLLRSADNPNPDIINDQPFHPISVQRPLGLCLNSIKLDLIYIDPQREQRDHLNTNSKYISSVLLSILSFFQMYSKSTLSTRRVTSTTNGHEESSLP